MTSSQRRRAPPFERLEGRPHLGGVAGPLPQRLAHVGDQGAGPAAEGDGGLDQQAGQRFGLGALGEEGAVAGLDVEDQGGGAGGELLRQDAAGDQRERADRAGLVAEGVEAAVGRSDLAGGDADRHPVAAEEIEAAPAVEVERQAGDRFQLVGGAAGVAEAAAGEHHHLDAADGEDRRQHQRHRVGDAAGGVLVGEPGRSAARSQRSPDSSIARVRAWVSPPSRPRIAAAIRKAASWASLHDPSAAPDTTSWISSSVRRYPWRWRSRMRKARLIADPRASARSPARRGPGPAPGRPVRPSAVPGRRRPTADTPRPAASRSTWRPRRGRAVRRSGPAR